MAAPPSPRSLPSALPDELVEEILLHLPPDDPASLLRASLVCKAWSHAFRRRLYELHRTPPMLGYLHNWRYEHVPGPFIPTTSSSFSLAAPNRRSWRAIDYRHGRALFISKETGTKEVLVWEPITGAQRRVPLPAPLGFCYRNTAVLCAADGCDHRVCRGGPFHLVALFTVVEILSDEEKYAPADEDYITSASACVYSSETGKWGELNSMRGGSIIFPSYTDSSLLVGTSLLYFMSDNRRIHEHDLARHTLTELNTPEYYIRSSLMLTPDGGLGVIQIFDTRLRLWSLSRSSGVISKVDTDARWLLSRVICLENLLPDAALVGGSNSIHVLSFVEAANVIFVSTLGGLFTIQLQSQRVRKVRDDEGCNDQLYPNLFPVVSFYTPHSRLEAGEHHYRPLLPSPIEQVSRNEGGSREEDKTVEQAQELFDKCKAMEKGKLCRFH